MPQFWIVRHRVNFLAFILVLVVVTAAVCFVVARFIRTNWLCIAASVIIAESLVTLYGLVQAVDSPHAEDVLLGVVVTAMFGTPVVIVSAWGSTFLARKVYRKTNGNS